MPFYDVDVVRSHLGKPGLLSTITAKNCRDTLGCANCTSMCHIRMETSMTINGLQTRTAHIETDQLDTPCSGLVKIEVVKKRFF